MGSSTPKRCSRKRRVEVWSNAWELTQPPTLQGESTRVGRRGPGPKGRPSDAGLLEAPGGAGMV
ncbi:hypothetical protein D3C80_2198460 [compost metagenome]